MFRRIIRIIGIILMIAAIAYFGVCIYANVVGEDTGLPEEDANYAVYIVNTGNMLLTSSYELDGVVYTLHGFWQYDGKDWRYSDTDIPLDQDIFGKINIRSRK